MGSLIKSNFKETEWGENILTSVPTFNKNKIKVSTPDSRNLHWGLSKQKLKMMTTMTGMVFCYWDYQM